MSAMIDCNIAASAVKVPAFRTILAWGFYPQAFQSNTGEGVPTAMNNVPNNAYVSDHDDGAFDLDHFPTLNLGFDDEEFLTSRAMYHCWSDRPRGRRTSNRRLGRRRSAGKPSSHHSLARR